MKRDESREPTEPHVTLGPLRELGRGGRRLAVSAARVAVGTDDKVRILRDRDEDLTLARPPLPQPWTGADLDRLRLRDAGAAPELLAAPYAVDLGATRWAALPDLEPALLHGLAGPPRGQLRVRGGDWSADGLELLLYVDYLPPRGLPAVADDGGDGGDGDDDDDEPRARLLWLDRARHVALVPWTGNSFEITTVVLGARWAVAAGAKLWVWDRATRRAVADLAPHARVIRDVALSGDEALLASVGNDRRAVVTDTATWRPLAAWEAHDGDVTAVAFHPSRPLLATTGQDGQLRVWSTTGRRLAEASLGAPGTAVAFSPDGSRLVAATAKRTLSFPLQAE